MFVLEHKNRHKGLINGDNLSILSLPGACVIEIITRHEPDVFPVFLLLGSRNNDEYQKLSVILCSIYRDMKQLIILRHGKAEQDTMAKDDYDRILTDRGRRNAAAMGEYILKKTGVPDLILTSSAKRAHETALYAAQHIGYPEEEIQNDQNLYFAPARWILNILSKLPEEVNSCLYVGHNPGVTDLVNDLGVRLDNLPTASAVCFEFNIDSWKEISAERANFMWLKTAKEL